MPRIFDNIDQALLPALRETLQLADRADFCVGYFNLRGWKQLDESIERWSGGTGHCCRLLVGMQRLPQEDLRTVLSILAPEDGIDNQTALRLKHKLAHEFREQLMLGVPTRQDEIGLRRLASQLRAVERNISDVEIRQAGANAEIIEDYPDDKYSPSCLLLGFTVRGHPLHRQVSCVD